MEVFYHGGGCSAPLNVSYFKLEEEQDLTVGLGNMEVIGDLGKTSFIADWNRFKGDWKERIDHSGVRHRLQGCTGSHGFQK